MPEHDETVAHSHEGVVELEIPRWFRIAGICICIGVCVYLAIDHYRLTRTLDRDYDSVMGKIKETLEKPYETMATYHNPGHPDHGKTFPLSQIVKQVRAEANGHKPVSDEEPVL